MKRICSVLLAIVLCLTSLVPPLAAGAAEKQTVTRAVAVVYDNSGSMYYKTDAWCRASYAMEVFGSMLNQGDTLYIYPMNPITVGEGGSTVYDMHNPYVIKGGEDPSAIRSFYSTEVGDTPISAITAAYEGVLSASEDQKWLMVLTDGKLFAPDLGAEEWSASETEQQLSAMLNDYSKNVNLMYLGIGDGCAMPQFTDATDYVRYTENVSTSDQILQSVTNMCNQIFGRDAMSVSGTSVEFDVSMKKLLVFVQGSDIGDVALVDGSGRTLSQSGQVFSPRYSDLPCGHYPDAPRDTALSGMIASYSDLPAGSYSLSFSGTASSTQIYYEPDVDLAAFFEDENGTRVDDLNEFYPGTYYLNYGLVDNTGALTDSSLLGDKKFSITYSVDGQEQTEESTSNGRVPMTLTEGSIVNASVTATYLSGYTITKDSEDMGWPAGGAVVCAFPAGELLLNVSGGSDSYSLSQLDQAEYEAVLRFDGQTLTAEQLERTELSVSIAGGTLDYDAQRTDTGYIIRLQHAGTPGDTVPGDYSCTVNASYTDDYGQSVSAEPVTLMFTIEEEAHTLTVQLDADTSFFTTAQLKDSVTVPVTVLYDGTPLTGEQLDNVSVTAEGDTLRTAVTRGEDGYLLTLSQDTAEPGKVPLTVSASMTDELGRTISGSAEKKVTVSPYPVWMFVLFALAAVAGLLAILVFYYTRKRLPKRILVESTDMTINGKPVDRSASVKNPKDSVRRILTVTPPMVEDIAASTSGILLYLEAIDPRRIKSAKRRAKLTKVIVQDRISTTALEIGGVTFVKNRRNEFVPETDLEDEPDAQPNKPRGLNIPLQNHFTCEMVSEFRTDRNVKKRRIVEIRFEFR